jgi:hypothetical protein
MDVRRESANGLCRHRAPQHKMIAKSLKPDILCRQAYVGFCARASAVKLAVSEPELERIARPSLALDWNAVAVTEEADAAAKTSQ